MVSGLKEIFHEAIDIFLVSYASIICEIFSGSQICNRFLSATLSSRVIVEKRAKTDLT